MEGGLLDRVCGGWMRGLDGGTVQGRLVRGEWSGAGWRWTGLNGWRDGFSDLNRTEPNRTARRTAANRANRH